MSNPKRKRLALLHMNPQEFPDGSCALAYVDSDKEFSGMPSVLATLAIFVPGSMPIRLSGALGALKQLNALQEGEEEFFDSQTGGINFVTVLPEDGDPNTMQLHDKPEPSRIILPA